MNFSTNQVMQLFVLGNEDTAEVATTTGYDGNTKYLHTKIYDSEGNIIDSTDIVEKANILSVTLSDASNDEIYRKALLVSLSPNVNNGNPIVGQEYIMTLTFRGFGEEDTISKVAYAKAKSEDAAKLLQDLAKNLLLNRDVEYSPLYELMVGDAIITKENADELIPTITKDGFAIVEPVPYWSLGRFAETLMKIDVQTAPVVLDGEEEIEWLASYKFTPVEELALPNSRRVADLEYFCKGERGTSNALVGWPDTPDYVAKVNPKSTKGYDILTIHYAYVGANASNQKSEKDLIFVQESGVETANGLYYIQSAYLNE